MGTEHGHGQLALSLWAPTEIVCRGPNLFEVRAGKPQEWVSTGQVAAAFGVDRSTVARWVQDGTIPSEQVTRGGKLRYRIAAAAISALRSRWAGPHGE